MNVTANQRDRVGDVAKNDLVPVDRIPQMRARVPQLLRDITEETITCHMTALL
jgi:hypothetical protein